MENNTITIPYIAFEITEAKNERIIKRLIIALVISIVLLFGTNLVWILESFSFETIDTETVTTVDAAGGTANYIGQDGDITYGENNGKNSNSDS